MMDEYDDDGSQEAEEDRALQEALYALEEEAHDLQALLDALREAQGADRLALLQAMFEEAMTILFMLDYLIVQCPPASLREDARALRKPLRKWWNGFPYAVCRQKISSPSSPR